jgi:prophage regulatory protein
LAKPAQPGSLTAIAAVVTATAVTFAGATFLIRVTPTHANKHQGVPRMSSQTPATPATPIEHRILRRNEVENKTGFKRAHIYALMKDGKFPKPIRLGVRAVGWDSLEIEQWITERLKERV